MLDKRRILVISPEFQIRRFLRVNLESLGYDMQEIETGQETLLYTVQLQPDLIILDRDLVDLDGLTVLERLRQRVRAPIVMLISDESPQSKISAAESGADDCFIKPIAIDDLTARISTLLQYSDPQAHDVIFTAGDVHVDLAQRRVSVQGQLVKLTATEYALLRFMIRHAGKVLTHRQILKSLWGEHSAEKTHYLRVYISKLRQKLEQNPDSPRVLLTEDSGYRLMIRVLVFLFPLYNRVFSYVEPLTAISTEVL